MMDAGRHPRIEILTLSEVVDVQGYVGNFQVRVRRKPRYVIEDLCTGCGACVEACVWKDRVPSEFEAGMGMRNAAYIPFPQAVPLKAVIDPHSCLWLVKGKCGKKCERACERGAIDFEMQETFLDLKVGVVILATGFDLTDDPSLARYGYGVYDNVIDGLQFERLSSAGGPTGGRILTKDGRVPKAIAFLHCIGSRDDEASEYCSRICCMYATKQAHLAREKTGGEVYQFYIDMRTAGKGYEEFYKRIQKEGVYFIRGKVADVVPDDGRLLVRAEDTLLGRLVEVPVDMVVLATAARPAKGSKELAQLFNVSLDKDGFFMEAHPKLRPVSTHTDGIFLAGCCQSPKDIPDTVAQASAAATRALVLLNQGQVEIEPTTARVIEARCSGCGECTLVCAYSAIEVVEGKARVNEALCKGCGTCAAACLAKAIVAQHFTDEELVAEITGIFERERVLA
ncbi:MAG TPA: CoB--CoM heterodisulfide reductase iron-sulfur subunit A family protein [Thermoflexia bacterium]|nr:CoB--CoM heterodisulfide reductase iron-sulfur subunit A family protein [Thermoflexia bacterium]